MTDPTPDPFEVLASTFVLSKYADARTDGNAELMRLAVARLLDHASDGSAEAAAAIDVLTATFLEVCFELVQGETA